MTVLLATLVVAVLFIIGISWTAAAVALNGGKHKPMRHKPEDFKLPYERVEFPAADGVPLRGWFVRAVGESDRTIVFCHGWGANKGEVLANTHFLHDAGFNLFYFDFRLCGESGGQTLSVGALEARDFDGAVAFLKATRPKDRLAVYGISMGSMVAFGGLARYPEIEAAALECPYTSHDGALTRYAWAKFRIPRYPFMPLVFFFVRSRLGFDPDRAISPERLADRVDGKPILAICGENDPIAVPADARRLLSKLRGPSELWIVPGAGHAQCGVVAGRLYEEKLAGFFSSRFA